MIRIESLGSLWWIDTTNKTYVRTPKKERLRDKEEHEGRGTPLEDLERHSYTEMAFLELLLGNYWDRKYGPFSIRIGIRSFSNERQHVVAVIRFTCNITPRGTPLGLGPWVHAPLTVDQYAEAQRIFHELT